jgi:chromosome segregation ATPase
VKLFSRRIAELETKNRILTDAAQKRTQRIEELEPKLEQIERVKSDRAFFSNRIAQLEEHNRQLEEHNRQLTEAATKYASWAEDYPRLEAERAFYFNRVVGLEEHNRQLTEAATKYALRIQELEREFERIALIKPDPST